MVNNTSSPQETSSVGLKPCPFCDNQNNMRVDDCDEAGNYPVRCFECFSTGPAYGEKARAVKAWNTRPRELALLEGLKVCRDAFEKLNGFGRADMGHQQMCDYTNETCEEALTAIQALLSTEAQQ